MMLDLTTTFLGIDLKNPLIIASSPLTENAESILLCEKYGAGGVIAKSCSSTRLNETGYRRCALNNRGWWAASSFNREIQDVNETRIYLERAVRESRIPIFASVSELTLEAEEWLSTCRILQETKVAGIQLDLFYFENMIGELDFIAKFVDLLRTLTNELEIPIFPKLNINLPTVLMASIFKDADINFISLLDSVSLPAPIQIDATGSPSLRFAKHVERASLFGAWQYPLTIKYLYELQKGGFEICAGGGIQESQDIIELIMRGAQTVQVATAVILAGYPKIGELISGVEEYMLKNSYESIETFRCISLEDNIEPASYYHVKAKHNPVKCTNCYKCVSHRFCTAISKGETGIKIDASICEGCALCVDLCSFQAISLE